MADLNVFLTSTIVMTPTYCENASFRQPKSSETYLPFQTPSPYPLNLGTAPLPKLRVCRFPGRTAKLDAERLW
jgi:hypothetical protein